MQLFGADEAGLFAARQGESSMAVRFLAGEQRILLAVERTLRSVAFRSH